jgi:hypothetical protein
MLRGDTTAQRLTDQSVALIVKRRAQPRRPRRSAVGQRDLRRLIGWDANLALLAMMCG